MDDDGFDESGRARLSPRLSGRVGPWVEWFGAGRIIGAVLAAVVVVLGGWWLLRAPTPPTEARLPFAGSTTNVVGGPAAATSSTTTTTTKPTAVIVHVAGAVAAPGVYELPAGARVVDALDAAGGTTPDADPAALNLAAVVGDGERVYVVRIGESPPPPAPSGASTPPGSSTPTGPIDLNHASAEDLDELPGIGPATATAIVAHRDEHGPFASVDDLEAVPGIGPAKLDAVRDLVTT